MTTYFVHVISPERDGDFWMGKFAAEDDEHLFDQIDAHLNPYDCIVVEMPKHGKIALHQWKRFDPHAGYRRVLEDAPTGWIVMQIMRVEQPPVYPEEQQ